MPTTPSPSTPSTPTQQSVAARQRSAWRRNLILIALLLLAWASVAFVPSYLARDLSGSVLGWPFSFWMAAFGGPLAFLVIVCLYAWLMNRKPRGRP